MIFRHAAKTLIDFLFPDSQIAFARSEIFQKNARELGVARRQFHAGINGPTYTRDGSFVWDELGQRTIIRLIIRPRINTGKQTDDPSRRTTWIIRLHRRITEANSSERIIRL